MPEVRAVVEHKLKTLSHLLKNIKRISKYSTVIEIFMCLKKGGRQQVAKWDYRGCQGDRVFDVVTLKSRNHGVFHYNITFFIYV